jgi:hypothetical protein
MLLQDNDSNGAGLPPSHNITLRSSSRGRSNSPIGSPRSMQWPRRVASPDRVRPASPTAASTAPATASATATASASGSSADNAAAALEEEKLELLDTAVTESEAEHNGLPVHSTTVVTGSVSPLHTQHTLLVALEEVSTQAICMLKVAATDHKCYVCMQLQLKPMLCRECCIVG